MKRKIIQNAARCLKCKTIIVSLHTHENKRCECGAVCVDGGKDYLKRSYIHIEDVEDYSLHSDTAQEEINEKLLWGTRGKTGKDPLTFKPVRSLETSHLENILKTQENVAQYITEAILSELRIRKIENIVG